MFLLLLTSLLAFYLAWNLGANDVANSMGTSVGSNAITLRQAVVIAAILEVSGAVLFGQQVSATLATQIVHPQVFAPVPQVLVMGMVAVLMACGVWLNLATALGLPVSSSHAIVGAIAGVGWVAGGVNDVDWHSLGVISLTWIATPIASAGIAALFYSLIKRLILDHPAPLAQLQEWIPWFSSVLLSIFGVIVLPTISPPIHAFLSTHLGWQFPAHDLPIVLGAGSAIALCIFSWHQLDGEIEARQKRKKDEQKTEDSTYPSPHLSIPESLLARFQVLSACFVAFAHGANDVGNAIAPLAIIVAIQQSGEVPTDGFPVPFWILALGGMGIVFGLAVWGKNVITTVGQGIIPLQPSAGFCAELATATTVLLASRLGFPVSTSHALVGGVVGVGLVQDWRSLQFQTLRSIALAWVITIPIATGLAAIGFLMISRFLP
jgi:PiT family inorganic phosphate transporter